MLIKKSLEQHAKIFKTEKIMNIVIIIAGGSGKRMLMDIPKQFLSVFDKPVIAYTMEAFQKNPNVDQICVVTLPGWTDAVAAYGKQYGISKLTHICRGGVSGFDSIHNGLLEIKDVAKDDDVVMIHDAIRPMVSQEIINDCIVKCKEFGNAVSVIPCQEVMLETTDEGATSGISIPRDNLKRTQTPQAVLYGEFLKLHNDAIAHGNTASIATASLLIEEGRTVHLSAGSEKNIKLTTPDDLDIFKALLLEEKKNV